MDLKAANKNDSERRSCEMERSEGSKKEEDDDESVTCCSCLRFSGWKYLIETLKRSSEVQNDSTC